MTTEEIVGAHAAELGRILNLVVQVTVQGDRFLIVLRQVQLPRGAYKVSATDVLMIAERQYPFAAMDMFWTDLDVVLADSKVPQNADTIEQYDGRSWRRFSWHRNNVWNPHRSNPLLDHFTFVEQRWALDLVKR